MEPQRIQRKRTKGFRLPPNTVCVNRGTHWGNPFKIGVDGDRYQVLQKYRDWLLPYQSHEHSLTDFHITTIRLKEIKSQLKGKNLACFCSLDQPCHADILLELANK